MLAVKQIDRALKRLYNIETPFCAEEFLILHYPVTTRRQVGSKELQGALYIHEIKSKDKTGEPEVNLGIYLSEPVRKELENFPDWVSPWTLEQVKAFSIASEEVSHFHYLIFNLERERPLSEFEIELQGEIDKFLLLYFSESLSIMEPDSKFELIFSQLFIHYRLATFLTENQRQRYFDASTCAKKFFQKMRKHFRNRHSNAIVLAKTRSFYQMGLADKMAFLG